MMTVPVRCRVPASFTPVDLTGGPAQRADALAAGLPTDAAGVAELIRHHEAFAQQLLAVHAGYAAVFLLPPGRPGYFAITEPAGMPPDLDTLADDLAVDPDAEVRRVELPCGPAVRCVEYARVAAGPTSRPNVDVVQEHAFAIHPTAGRVVAFTLGVHDAHRRPEYAELFAEILRTVAFPAS